MSHAITLRHVLTCTVLGLLKQRGLVVTVPVAIAVALAALVIYITRDGIGLSIDSTTYVFMAQSMSGGRDPGNDAPWLTTGLSGRPFQFPMVYPLVISWGEWLGLPFNQGVLFAARWVNVVCGFVSVVLVFAISLRLSKSVLAATITAVLFALAHGVVTTHMMLYSEPLALTLHLVAFALAILCKRLGWRMVVLLAAVSGACIMVRYASLPLVGGLFLTILLTAEGTRQSRWLRAIAFSFLAVLPLIVVVLMGLLKSGKILNRTLQFHPPSQAEMMNGLSTIATFVTPASFSGDSIWPGLLAVVVAVLAALSVSLLKPQDSTSVGVNFLPGRGCVLLWSFAVCFVAFVLLVMTFIDNATPLDARILIPLHTGLLLIVVSTLARIKQKVRFALLLSAVVVIGLQLHSTIAWVRVADERHLGFASRHWRESDIIRWINHERQDLLIYTNNPHAVALLTGRPAVLLPANIAYRATDDVEDFELRMSVMAYRLSTWPGEGVVVYFDESMTRRRNLCSPKQLEEALSVTRIKRDLQDGIIYKPTPDFVRARRLLPEPTPTKRAASSDDLEKN